MSGYVYGTVTAGGNSLSGVTVTASGSAATTSTTTDNQGGYSFLLPYGDYNITCSKSGYEDVTLSITVTTGVTNECDFDMFPPSDASPPPVETTHLAIAVAGQMNITLDQDVINGATAAEQHVTIVQKFDGSHPLVVWVAAKPAKTIVVTWTKGHTLFISDSAPEVGVVLQVQNPQKSVDINHGYDYTEINGSPGFGDPVAGFAPSTITVTNDMSESVNIGLAGDVAVNGASNLVPTCAATVASNGTVNFTFLNECAIFFSSYYAGEVISGLPADACTVSFNGDDTSSNITYNPAKGFQAS